MLNIKHTSDARGRNRQLLITTELHDLWSGGCNKVNEDRRSRGRRARVVVGAGTGARAVEAVMTKFIKIQQT